MCFHVVDDADDLTPLLCSAANVKANLSSQRVLIVQMPMYKFLVYDDDAGRIGIVSFSKRSSTERWDTGSLKIIRTNYNMEGIKPLISRQFGLVFDLKRRGCHGPRCRQVGRHRDSLSTRNLFEPG